MIVESARREIAVLLAHIPETALTVDVWTETAELAWRMDRVGLVRSLPCLVIAVCARRAKATLVTRDRHFQKIADLVFRRDLPEGG